MPENPDLKNIAGGASSTGNQANEQDRRTTEHDMSSVAGGVDMGNQQSAPPDLSSGAAPRQADVDKLLRAAGGVDMGGQQGSPPDLSSGAAPRQADVDKLLRAAGGVDMGGQQGSPPDLSSGAAPRQADVDKLLRAAGGVDMGAQAQPQDRPSLDDKNLGSVAGGSGPSTSPGVRVRRDNLSNTDG